MTCIVVPETGSGSIGVRLLGEGNILANYGNVSGALYSVLGDDSRQVIYNGGVLSGPVALNGGDDAYGFVAGSGAQPVVDAGGEVTADLLYVVNTNAAIPAAAQFTLFSGFETFQKAGLGRVVVRGVLAVPDGTVLEGSLEIPGDAQVQGDLTCLPGTAIVGSGLVVGNVIGIGCAVGGNEGLRRYRTR